MLLATVIISIKNVSLKTVEKHLGYKRELDEYAGDRSIARYLEAVESNDESHRDEIVAELRQYNGEDLEATWVALQWLKGLTPSTQGTIP